jgi:very-short-patch-repair endonuclease
LAWPEIKLAVEYDGQWHADRTQLAHDRTRLRALNAAGWRVFHVTDRDMGDLATVLRELKAVHDRRSRNLKRRR